MSKHCEMTFADVSYSYYIVYFFQTEWSGANIYDLVHPDDMEKIQKQLSFDLITTTNKDMDRKKSIQITRMYKYKF